MTSAAGGLALLAALSGSAPARQAVPVVPAQPVASVPAQPDRDPAEGVTTHVVVISIDGLRPDAIERYGLETLGRLMREGSFSLDAQTIMPSKTLPSHTSMLTGVSPEVHGITFNHERADAGIVGVPTIFELARLEGHHTAAFFSKAKFRHLDRANAYDYRQAPESNIDNWMATRTIPDAVQYLRHERPNLLFVHIGEPDYAGHTMGWMSVFYGWAAKRADGAVDRLLDAADAAFGVGEYTVILTADHGGHAKTHGSDDPEDTTIPWIVWGEGVRAGEVTVDVRTMDTAATALWLLGVDVPADWEGHPVRSAFAARVTATADS